MATSPNCSEPRTARYCFGLEQRYHRWYSRVRQQCYNTLACLHCCKVPLIYPTPPCRVHIGRCKLHLQLLWHCPKVDEPSPDIPLLLSVLCMKTSPSHDKEYLYQLAFASLFDVCGADAAPLPSAWQTFAHRLEACCDIVLAAIEASGEKPTVSVQVCIRV